MAGSEERMVASGDAEICTQTFGDPGDPPLLLLTGQMCSMLWWPQGLCERLAGAGRFVIRYDQRDSGRSSSYPPGDPPYSGADMIGDALGVLDAYDVERAHLVGISAGGGVAQEIALLHPQRVASLTAISTSGIAGSSGLPGPTPEYLDHAKAAAGLDWSDIDALAEFLLADMRQLSSAKHPFDEDAAREFIAGDLARTVNPASLVNHELLAEDVEAPGTPAELRMPVLVIHGSADPLFPHEHGAALAAEVPGATLVTIEGGGHELHPADWDLYVSAIAGVTAASSD